MTTAIAELEPVDAASWRTFEDVARALGDVPIHRILLDPRPGTATAADMVAMTESKFGRIVELVDGTLVEKAMGKFEDVIGFELGLSIGNYVKQNQLGVMNGAQGMTTMITGNIRMPDLMFTAKERITMRQLRAEPAPAIAPDLSVEVLSDTNSKSEMLKKRRELFASGTRLIWEFEPTDHTVAVYTSPETPDAILDRAATLTGGDVLPGFTLDLAAFWAQFDD